MAAAAGDGGSRNSASFSKSLNFYPMPRILLCSNGHQTERIWLCFADKLIITQDSKLDRRDFRPKKKQLSDQSRIEINAMFVLIWHVFKASKDNLDSERMPAIPLTAKCGTHKSEDVLGKRK